MPLPLDLRLALTPLDTYRQLMAEPVRGAWPRALERPALVAIIIGTAVTVSSAKVVPIGLVLMGIVCWSFVPERESRDSGFSDSRRRYKRRNRRGG